MIPSAPSPSVSFADLGLSQPTLNALRNVQFEKPSPIQAAFIPLAMSGADCIGQAHTGTGKTAAFVLPLLERLNFDNCLVQALVLTPTRELSEQIAQECKRLSYSSMCRSVCIVGGRPIRTQINELEKGVHRNFDSRATIFPPDRMIRGTRGPTPHRISHATVPAAAATSSTPRRVPD